MLIFLKLFRNISSENKGKVDVFFCGNSEFGRIVQKKSIQFKYLYNNKIEKFILVSKKNKVTNFKHILSNEKTHPFYKKFQEFQKNQEIL